MESNREKDCKSIQGHEHKIEHPQRSSSYEQQHTLKQEEDLIADFSGMFKRKGSWAMRKPKNKTKETKSPNWLLEIPAKLDLTIEDIKVRRVMDQRKWISIAKSSGSLKIIAAVCSCWNYLTSSFFTVNACLEIMSPDLTHQQIITATEYHRVDLINKAISCLNKKTNQSLSSKIFVKLSDPFKLEECHQDQKNKLLKGLSSEGSAYIYLGHEDVFCPIGYDITPLKQIQAYQRLQKMSGEDQELWIISSSLGRNEASFCIKRWSDVQKDLETVWPYYFDIKEAKQGPRVRADVTQENKGEKRGTSNCIIQICRG